MAADTLVSLRATATNSLVSSILLSSVWCSCLPLLFGNGLPAGRQTHKHQHTPLFCLPYTPCWKTLVWCFMLKYTLAYPDSIHQQYKHTFCLVWPPAVSPHPYHCSFTDNTAILDALKKHASYKRAHRHLICSSFTDISHTSSYTIEFSKSRRNLDSAGL